MSNEEDLTELQRIQYSLIVVQKGLYRMNLICVIVSGLFWLISMITAVKDGLKHGVSWDVITVVDGVQKITTRNTFINVGMSGVFLFMMITATLSFCYLKILNLGVEKETIEV
jgi:uncharacterized membrane protein YuzA (DUF378 family)